MDLVSALIIVAAAFLLVGCAFAIAIGAVAAVVFFVGLWRCFRGV
jgi:hypothetical protein